MNASTDLATVIGEDTPELCFTSLAIQTRAGDHLDATLLDGNGHGMAILVPSTHRVLQPEESIGVSMEVSGERFLRPARVRSHVRLDELDRYGIEFETPIQATAQELPVALRRAFVRRRSPRLRFLQDEDVQAWAISERAGLQCAGRLSNLSADGACIELPEEDARRLEGVDRMILELQLPGDELRLGLSARVRGRLRCAGRGFLSLAFDPDAQRRLRFSRERIGEFVRLRLENGRRAA